MYKIYCGNALDILKTFASDSVQTCITSPPYFRLRNYGVNGQIGLEETLEEYIAKLREVFCEVRRVLRSDGTLWLNLADTYANSGRNSGTDKIDYKQSTNSASWGISNKVPGFKKKDMMLVPFKVAEALRADGWYLRQDIIWAKNNPMPESVKDRCTKSHEYIFLFSKSQKYYFDSFAIKEQAKANFTNIPNGSNGVLQSVNSGKRFPNKEIKCEYRNKRDVWFINTKPYRAAHFATFPEKLVEPCILAGSNVDGVILDPFCGSGTTGAVAVRYNRNFIGIDLNHNYCDIADIRIRQIEVAKTL